MNFNRLMISVDLKPEVSFDEETKMFVAKFTELPAIAFDDTEEKAILKLISIFEVILKEQKELVFDRVIKRHIEEAMKEDPSYSLVRIQGMNNNKDQMKLQLTS